jgi:predicted nucleic acid-binding protein
VPQAELDSALAGCTRALLDSSALIAYHSPAEDVHHLARHLLERIEDEQDPLCAYYSAITAMELLMRPIRAGSHALTFKHAFLSAYPYLTLLPVDLQVATQAATVRALSNLKTPDCLIIACGLLANCDALVFNDEAWGSRLRHDFKQIPWICLREYR